ncbi:MAG TPA: SRPBCC family protein [Blastocatellia bacterium]|nr:SRPBCC family protein [Blastocatellia bacterium]
MEIYVLERAQIIERSLDATFEFFSDAHNLEKITPAFLRFKIMTPRPLQMQAGTRIDYSLSLFGIPFRWQTLIETWEPGVQFVDRQVKGPYALWVHTHTFTALNAEQTLMRDRVEYQLPLGWLGKLAHKLFVAATLKKIFDYRAQSTARLLAPMTQTYAVRSSSAPPQKFAAGAGD